MAKGKKIKAVSLVSHTSMGEYDLAYEVGKDKVTAIVDNPETIIVAFGPDVIRLFNKEHVAVYEIELEEVEIPEQTAANDNRKELVLPKKELITPDGKVIDLDEVKKNKNKR